MWTHTHTFHMHIYIILFNHMRAMLDGTLYFSPRSGFLPDP